VGHNFLARIKVWATNFCAAIKGWATKSADTKYLIFPAPPLLLYDWSLNYFKTSIVTVNNSQGEMFVFKDFSDNLGKKLMKHL
jgi:hypothetical protein